MTSIVEEKINKWGTLCRSRGGLGFRAMFFFSSPARRMGQITPNEAYSTVKMIFIAVAPNEACSTVKTSRMLSRAIRKRTRERRYLTKAFLTKHLSKYYIFENPPEGINSRLGLAERALPPSVGLSRSFGA